MPATDDPWQALLYLVEATKLLHHFFNLELDRSSALHHVVYHLSGKLSLTLLNIRPKLGRSQVTARIDTFA